MKEDYFSHLNSAEKDILKNKGTEAPFSGEYNNFFAAGLFICRACKSPLYESNTKFDSGCGWPSFDDEIDGAIVRHEDLSRGRVRTEICCANCDGHLGHVFYGEKITKKDTRHCVNSLSLQFKAYKDLTKATFGAGCFWTVQKIYNEIEGVYFTQSGYMGGEMKDPKYKDVCSGKTNHAEVVSIYFNTDIISYKDLLDNFWKSHNPTNFNRQGNDRGTQYRSVIFYYTDEQRIAAHKSLKEKQLNLDKPIVTQIESACPFFRAEEYHQNYLEKNNLESCSI